MVALVLLLLRAMCSSGVLCLRYGSVLFPAMVSGYGACATDGCRWMGGRRHCEAGGVLEKPPPVTGALRAWSSGAGPMQFIKKLKRKEKATEPGLGVGP